jgi:hypothetical protein
LYIGYQLLYLPSTDAAGYALLGHERKDHAVVWAAEIILESHVSIYRNISTYPAIA